MTRKTYHLFHQGETEASKFTITEDIEEFSIREVIRDKISNGLTKILNTILRLPC